MIKEYGGKETYKSMKAMKLHEKKEKPSVEKMEKKSGMKMMANGKKVGISKGMMEDYTSVPRELSADIQSIPGPGRKPTPPEPKNETSSTTVKKMHGGKIGRGCGAAMKGGGAVMYK